MAWHQTGDKPSPGPMLLKNLWCHMASLDLNELTTSDGKKSRLLLQRANDCKNKNTHTVYIWYQTQKKNHRLKKQKLSILYYNTWYTVCNDKFSMENIADSMKYHCEKHPSCLWPLFVNWNRCSVMTVTGFIVNGAVNSLWLSDTIWWHKFGSTLAQVMACCLMAPNHYPNQCWFIIKGVLWHSP